MSVSLLVVGDVKPPVRRDGVDAGIDLFVPNLSESFVKDLMDKNPGQPVRWGIVGAGDPDSEDPNKGFFIQIGPHQDVLIPSYVKAKLPPNICLRASNKGSVATRLKLIVGAEIIDSSYQGVIFIHLINTSPVNQFVSFGQKMVQLIPIVIDDSPIELYYSDKVESFKDYKNFIPEADFYPEATERGEAGFGSTGAQ